jgi:sialidase-1
VAANHSAGPPQAHFLDYVANGFYTDDHGKTFHLAADIPVPGGNEAMAVELPDGALIVNARIQSGSPRCRLVAISHSGGEEWDTVRYDKNLPDPVCQGSILELLTGSGNEGLAFCNNADTAYRNHLTLKISDDRGRTWNVIEQLDERPSSTIDEDPTAYSDLVELKEIGVGILYERNDYREIVFRPLSIKKQQ